MSAPWYGLVVDDDGGILFVLNAALAGEEELLCFDGLNEDVVLFCPCDVGLNEWLELLPCLSGVFVCRSEACVVCKVVNVCVWWW